jgi:hypothetical protein
MGTAGWKAVRRVRCLSVGIEPPQRHFNLSITDDFLDPIQGFGRVSETDRPVDLGADQPQGFEQRDQVFLHGECPSLARLYR